MQNNFDLVVVGAGPCGLLTAIQSELRARQRTSSEWSGFPYRIQPKMISPKLKIRVYEKYQTYQRDHVVRLNPSSFKNCADHPKIEELKGRLKKNPYIQTLEIEGKLKKIAQELGIEIVHEEIRDIEQIPPAKVIVGADGAHSFVRDKFFKNEMAFEESLNYVIELKYKVKGQAKSLPFTKLYKTSKVIEGFATEHVGSMKEGKTSVTLRIFVDRATYLKMADATFKHPYTLENKEKFEARVFENIQCYLNVRKDQLKEERLEKSEKITITPLGSYASRYAVKEVDGKIVQLVGDAFSGFSFFVGLNKGWQEAIEAGKAIAESLVPSTDDHSCCVQTKHPAVLGNPPSPFVRYAKFAHDQSKKERLIARIKNIFVKIAEWFIRLSHHVPWQLVKWSDSYILSMQNSPKPRRPSASKVQ